MQPDYRFVEQARRDLTALLAAHPELEQDEVLHIDMIEGNTNALELLDKLIGAERESKAFAEGLDFELERIRKRQIRFEHRQILIRKFIMQIMESAGLKKVERPAATVSVSAGRPKVLITDEEAIPGSYFSIKRELDKRWVSEALKAGEIVPGATLSNPEPQLRIS